MYLNNRAIRILEELDFDDVKPEDVNDLLHRPKHAFGKIFQNAGNIKDLNTNFTGITNQITNDENLYNTKFKKLNTDMSANNAATAYNGKQLVKQGQAISQNTDNINKNSNSIDNINNVNKDQDAKLTSLKHQNMALAGAGVLTGAAGLVAHNRLQRDLGGRIKALEGRK